MISFVYSGAFARVGNQVIEPPPKWGNLRPLKRVGAAAIQRRRATITAQIVALGLPLPGSLVERSTACGNPGCRCHADPPQLHGPYLSWTGKVDGKTVTRTLHPDQADRLRPPLDNARRLRELVSDLKVRPARTGPGPAQPSDPGYPRALI